MAVLIANTGNKTVTTVADRDNIVSRFNGMQVTVLDAIADINVGLGEACYQWSEALNKWFLIWKTSKDELIFEKEWKTIVSGQVTANHVPQNALVWNCVVRDSNNVILLEIDPTVYNKVIGISTNAYDGYQLHYNYAHGTATASNEIINCGTF